MHLKATPFSSPQEVAFTSDIPKVIFDEGKLLVTVARALDDVGNVTGIEVVFTESTAFRFLDELDLARYWISNDRPKGFHVLEVQSGGWADEESQLQGYDRPRREWLVVSGNGCVSVFSANEPSIQERRWPYVA
jgi:hypothetical protein